jgi:hypothetical protein
MRLVTKDMNSLVTYFIQKLYIPQLRLEYVKILNEVEHETHYIIEEH